MNKSDKRQSPRVQLPHFVVGLTGGDHTVEGNISSGGVGFALKGRTIVRPGDPVTVSLKLPESGESLVLSAIVCHTRYREADDQYVGARFIDVDLLVQNPLDRFVEETSLLHRAPSVRSRIAASA